MNINNILQNKTAQLVFQIAFVIGACLFAEAAFAAGGLNNLHKASDALVEIKKWLFIFVGTAAIVYLIYCVGMAFAERKSWSDVGMALVYCCLAGGAVVGGNWALGLFDGATSP